MGRKHDCLKDCSPYLQRLPWLTSGQNETRNHKIKSPRQKTA